MFDSIDFFCYYSLIEMKEIQMEKYNVKEEIKAIDERYLEFIEDI